MKTYMKIIILSLNIGIFLAIVFYKDIKNEVNAITKKDNTIYIFQVGVFTNEENAIDFQKKYDYSIIYKDNEYYRVVIGVATNQKTKEILISFFNRSVIDYYIKEMKVSNDLIHELSMYENILLKTNKDEVINSINKWMLKTFMTYKN